MLLTDKAEILNAMNKELSEASASSIKWLADTFDNQTVPHMAGVRDLYTPRGIIPRGIIRKYSNERPVFVHISTSRSRKQLVLKLSPDDISILEKQLKPFLTKSQSKKKKYSEHHRFKWRQTVK